MEPIKLSILAPILIIIHTARRRLRPEPSPLQLTHRTDLLDIDVERADLSAYDI